MMPRFTFPEIDVHRQAAGISETALCRAVGLTLGRYARGVELGQTPGETLHTALRVALLSLGATSASATSASPRGEAAQASATSASATSASPRGEAAQASVERKGGIDG